MKTNHHYKRTNDINLITIILFWHSRTEGGKKRSQEQQINPNKTEMWKMKIMMTYCRVTHTKLTQAM